MKMGLGTDITAVKRFEDIERHHGKLAKIFTNNEIVYALRKTVSAEVFAGHFAAKEALIKAFDYFGKKLLYVDIELEHAESGAPIAVIKGAESFAISVSISHEREYAIACALVLKK